LTTNGTTTYYLIDSNNPTGYRYASDFSPTSTELGDTYGNAIAAAEADGTYAEKTVDSYDDVANLTVGQLGTGSLLEAICPAPLNWYHRRL
jgi:hypothetical protein